MATLQPGEKARMYALGKIARGGATRGGYVSGGVFISIGGDHVGFGRDDVHVGTIIKSLSIVQQLDETPDTCALRVNGAVPPMGAEIVVTLGSKNRVGRLFGGYALTEQQLYAADKPANVQAEISAVDYTWLLGFAKVTKQYRGQSATAIIQDLIATYAAVNGFTTNAVSTTLPALDEITFTDENLPAAITRTMRRIGGYWFVDYNKNIHAWIGDDAFGGANPAALVPTHPSLADFRTTTEQTQGLTRVYVEGRGTRILGDVPPGETAIPVESADMFVVAADVFAKVAFAGSVGGAQHLTYSGVVPGGGGSLVGPGIGPSAKPTVATVPGAGLGNGVYDYAVTFVTSAGESLPGPRATISTGPVANPTEPPFNLNTYPTHNVAYRYNVPVGDQVAFAYAWSTGSTAPGHEGEIFASITLSTAGSVAIMTVDDQDPYNPNESAPVYMTIRYSPDPRVLNVVIFSSAASRPGWGYTAVVPNYPDRPPAVAGPGNNWSTNGASYGNLSPGYGLPAANTTGQNQVVISAIPIGSASVTARKIYRTAANGAQLKLVATLANNTATTYTDAAADASLGANAPAGDTSGLQQPAGQVPAGSTSLPVAGTAAFAASGGWAVIGNGEQVIRYSGIGGGALTGIPATGNGAILATVSYNSTVTAPDVLTGIPATGARSIQQRITAGDELYAVVQVDNADAQTALAAALGVANGIREEWIADRRLSVTEARARGLATLAARPPTERMVTYTCRDLNTAVGKTITVTLPAPTNVSGTFRIQQVTINNFRPRTNQYPTFTVTASSNRFTFEDWLRIMRTKE